MITGSRVETFVEKAWWVRGLTTGRGVGVLRPGYVAFLPTERPKNLAVEFAWGAAGFVEIGARKLDPKPLIAHLRMIDTIDERVVELAHQLAGILWKPSDAQLRVGTIPLRKTRRRLWFLAGRESIRFAHAFHLPEVEALAPLLALWPRAH